MPPCVAGAIQVLGFCGSLVTVGCDLIFTPDDAGSRGTYSPPPGIACGDSVCEAGTVCCLLASGPTCAEAGVLSLTPAVIEGGTCYGSYLGCDGPGDCPGATCCPLGVLFVTDYTACVVATSNDSFVCGFNSSVCHDDSDCPASERCVLDDGGPNYDPLAGYVSYCSP